MRNTALAAVLLATLLPAQDALTTAATERLHPDLAAALRTTAPTASLPVYFVLADRLGYEHWFPRVWSLPLADRRATVITELRAHAERTQQELLAYLRAEERAGNANAVSSNWLGNFVQARATPLAILTAAALPGIAEVWLDSEPALAEVQDDAVLLGSINATVPPTPAFGPPPPPSLLPPGVGPGAVFADRVWAYGIRGQGIVVANVDGGLVTSPTFHSDLAQNLWRNPGEIPGNNRDDDNNGLVDDVFGWDFAGNSTNLDDGGGHGTNTAGCLVADGTCSGVVNGMAPQAKLLTGKISNESSQWNAIQYALLMGADCQTSSYSYKASTTAPPNYKMHRDIGVSTLAAGLVRTNSTSNDGAYCPSTTDRRRPPTNISAPGCLPPPWLDPNQTLRGQLGGVLGVAAWNFTTDSLMSYSPCGPFAWNLADVQVNMPTYPVANWSAGHNDYPWLGGAQQGLLKPDLSAPTGTQTTGAAPCQQVTFSGTSNATPCAMGVIVLWKSANPSLTPEDIAMVAHLTARDRGTVPGKENRWGAGVIDAEAGLYRALCVHRIDGQPAWWLDHSRSGGPLRAALDGPAGSFAAMAIGLSRTPVPLGPITVGVGPGFAALWAGFLDGNGDASLNVPLPAAAVGLSLFTQGFVWDQTITNRILDSNVIEVRVRT